MQGKLNKRIENNEKVNDYLPVVPFPKNMLLEITNVCNNCCIFCANSKTTRKKKMMDLEFGKKILKEAYENGTREVGFYATGEPLVNMDLEKYIAYAKQTGYEYVYITTNGTLLDQKRAESLIDAGIDSVKFSINASNADDYLLIHGKDDFDKILNNIAIFDQVRRHAPKPVNLFLSCILTSFTQKIKEEMNLLFKDIVDDMFFLECVNQGGYMYEINQRLAIGGRGGYHPADNICPMFFKNLYVSVEGYLTMCCTDFQNYLVVADLNQEPLKDAWNNQYAQKLRLAHISHNLQGTLCFNCIYNTNKKIEPLTADYAVPFDYATFDSTDSINRRIMKWQQAKSDDAQEFKTGG